MKTTVLVPLFALLLVVPISALSHIQANASQQSCLQGVWNNFDFSRSPEEWSTVAREFGGDNGLIDLVAAQAGTEDLVLFPFPFESAGYLTSYSETDLLEPYLAKFDSENLRVLLSIQPLKSDVTQMIDILLTRYSHHSSLLGLNVDLEWKESGTPNSVSDEEKDLWLGVMKNKRLDLKLFLSYYKDYTHFPRNSTDLTVLFDGERDSQANLLNTYKELASHFDSVGIYTGYSSSSPPTASYQRIMDAVPKTAYIIHTEDVFSDKPTLIFEMDDVEADWNERTTMDLADLHLKMNMPLVCGVVPKNLDNSSLGGGYLSSYLRDLSQTYFDTFEVAQLGYTNNDSEAMGGMSYEEQKAIMEEGAKTLHNVGIDPSTFIPPMGSADNTTLKVAEELGFTCFVDLYENLSSSKLLILSSWITLTETDANTTVLKSPEQLMAEVDNKTGESPIIITYEVKDFASNTQNKLELSKIIDFLRNSEKYQFMTAKQYLQSLHDKPTAPEGTSSSPILPTWIFWFIVGGSAIIAVSFFSARRLRKKNQNRIDRSPTISIKPGAARADISQVKIARTLFPVDSGDVNFLPLVFSMRISQLFFP